MLLDAQTLCSNSFQEHGAPSCKPSVCLKIVNLVFTVLPNFVHCKEVLSPTEAGNLLHWCEMQVHHSVIPTELVTHLGGQKQCRLTFYGPLTNTCMSNLPIISHNRCTINIVCKPFMFTLYLTLPSHAPLYCISTILFARQLMTSRAIALGYV